MNQWPAAATNIGGLINRWVVSVNEAMTTTRWTWNPTPSWHVATL